MCCLADFLCFKNHAKRSYEDRRGFEKISLEPGEQKTLRFQLTPHDLSLLNRSMERVVEPGVFEVMIGRSCKDIRLRGSFEVSE